MNDKIKEMVIEQFGDEEYFRECAQDIVNHGASDGFSGFIYYSDTVPFGERLRPYIKPLMAEMAEEFGFDGVYSLIASFKCADGLNTDQVADAWASGEDDNHTQVMNCLAWFALEEVARELVESEEVEE